MNIAHASGNGASLVKSTPFGLMICDAPSVPAAKTMSTAPALPGIWLRAHTRATPTTIPRTVVTASRNTVAPLSCPIVKPTSL